MVALIYLLCILAPSLSYAMPGEHAGIRCMTIEGMTSGAMQMHAQDAHDQDALAHHLLKNGHEHGHSAINAPEQAGHHAHAIAVALAGEKRPAPTSPHTDSGQCCAMMCVSALPAPLFDIATPSVPTAIRVVVDSREMADSAPSRLYRPPIV